MGPTEHACVRALHFKHTYPKNQKFVEVSEGLLKLSKKMHVVQYQICCQGISVSVLYNNVFIVVMIKIFLKIL